MHLQQSKSKVICLCQNRSLHKYSEAKKIIKSLVTSQFGYYNGIRTHNYLVRKRTLKHLAKKYIHDLYMKGLNISRISNNDNSVSMHVRKL